MLASSACTFTALLLRGPNDGFGGPVPYFLVLFGSGALIAVAGGLLLARGRTGPGDR